MNSYGTIPTYEERMLLVSMVFDSTLDDEGRELAINWIVGRCRDYEGYLMMQFRLEDLRTPFAEIPCPSQTDIKLFIRLICKNGR